MKLLGKILLGLFVLFVVIPVLVVVLALGYLGFIPGLSNLMGTNKPRDLGIKYTEADRTSARGKSQVVYETLPPDTPPEKSHQTSGSRPIKTEFSSAEMTALMNNRPWKYWPYGNVQVKFNADGSGEISGVLIKDRVPAYTAAIGIPKEAVNLAMKLLPNKPVFYVKGKAALVDNKVFLFEPQTFQLGRISMPVDIFLSFVPPELVKEAYAAMDTTELTGELSKIQNKKALIVEYINRRLSSYPGFYAKRAEFAENKLIFEGTLPEKEAVVQ